MAYGRYRLLNRLGEGGMGVVYAAYDEHLERKIALKLIRPSLLGTAEARERTLREARALARLSHPNVVHVYEVGELEGQLFVAMEFLAGPTLRAWHKGQVHPWRETLRLFCQAGEGLAAAHAQGIIHRDFKPQNAMLGADGRVRVLDFGLARFGELEGAGALDASTIEDPARGLTITGAVLGTPAYMAPEQFQARKASERSDQFSFCVALFEALYGARPFKGETLLELMEALNAGRVAARPKDAAVPQRIHAVLLRGLQVDPAARWPSMQELLAAFEREPGARLRRTLAGVALVTFTGAASYGLAQPGATVERCPAAQLELAEIWSPARASTLHEGVHDKHGAQGDEVLGIVEPQLDRYAAQWSVMRHESCQAHAEGRQSSHVFDLRTACLDQRRASLDAMAQLLVSASQGPLEDLVKAASGLPALARCEDTQALLAAIAPPEDPAMQARVQAHRETLARAQVHENAGQYKPGLALVQTVLDDEVALAYEPLRAEALLARGSLEGYFDPREGIRSLEQALWSALAIGHAQVAAQASSKRGLVLAYFLGQQDLARDSLPMIMALNRRVEEDVELYAEYLNNAGMIQSSLGDWGEARRLLEEARDLRIARAHPVNWRSLETLMNLVLLAGIERRFADALALHREIDDTVIQSGPQRLQNEVYNAVTLRMAGRPRAASAVMLRILQTERSSEASELLQYPHRTLAFWALEDADPAAAREHLSAMLARGVWAIYRDLWTAQILMGVAALEGDQAAVQTHYGELSRAIEGLGPEKNETYCFYLKEHGRALEALGLAREAIVVYEQVRSKLGDSRSKDAAVLVADASLALGAAYRKLGDDPAAERELVRALAEHRALYPVAGPDHGRALYELGELALTRTRWDEARVHLVEAVASFAAIAEPDYPPLVRSQFALARALTGAAGPATAEARGLAEVAMQALASHGKDDEVRTIETWLAEHPLLG